jgi:2-polyprenyl-6-methoxyphenol hydroxylase-like FAD-dependent oxidoreductase
VTRRRSALVAGGGIGGLATATALARAGVAVTLLERAPRIEDVGSGLLLYQNGVAALDAIDGRLGAAVRAAGHPTGPRDTRLLLDSAGEVLAREPIGRAAREAGLPQVPILRTVLQRLLFDAAEAAGATVRLGTTVTGYRQDGEGVAVELAGGGRLEAGVLIAADGLNSVVRAAMLGDGPPEYRGVTSVRGRTVGAELYPQAFVVNGRGIQIFAAPAARDTLYWAAKISAPAGAWPAKGPVAALAVLGERIADWYPPVVAMVRATDPADVAVTDIHDRDPVPRWVDGRVALLGDAAHPMVPALGQGANLALEDAFVLSQAFRSTADPAEALLVYQAGRVDRAAAVVRHSRRQGSVDQGADRAAARERDQAIRDRGRKDAATFDVVAWRPGPPTTLPATG